MANPNQQNKPIIEKSEQELLNQSFDKQFNVLAELPVEWDGGTNLYRAQTDKVALRLDNTTTANVTYVGKAPIGTATSSAAWQIKRLDETSGLVVTWADGDANFDNTWDNRASITYS
jgi:hypothetical protein